MAQLVEHVVHIDGVTGSSPVQTAKKAAYIGRFFIYILQNRLLLASSPGDNSTYFSAFRSQRKFLRRHENQRNDRFFLLASLRRKCPSFLFTCASYPLLGSPSITVLISIMLSNQILNISHVRVIDYFDFTISVSVMSNMSDVAN